PPENARRCETRFIGTSSKGSWDRPRAVGSARRAHTRFPDPSRLAWSGTTRFVHGRLLPIGPKVVTIGEPTVSVAAKIAEVADGIAWLSLPRVPRRFVRWTRARRALALAERSHETPTHSSGTPPFRAPCPTRTQWSDRCTRQRFAPPFIERR